MSYVGFGERLRHACVAVKNAACLGIDPSVARLPVELADRIRSAPGREQAEFSAAAFLEFGKGVVDQAAGRVPVVKPQVAFFETLGPPGWAALCEITRYARQRGLLVIADAKRGDIGEVSDHYANALLDDDGPLAADAHARRGRAGCKAWRPEFRDGPRSTRRAYKRLPECALP